MSAPDPATLAAAASSAYHLSIAKTYSLAAVVLSFWEIAVTFDREVEAVWSRKWSFVTLLWACNRYIPSLTHIPTEFAFLHPFSKHQCLMFVHFPGVIQIISNLSIGLTLILRTYALYHRNYWVLVILFPFYLASFAVECWAVAGGAPVPLRSGFSGCILSGKPHSKRIAALWMGQLVFPTVIFILTSARIIKLRRRGTMRKDSIATLILRDGTVYFCVIFLANLMNVITYLSAPPDLQAVNASFSSIFQGIMICRLMLNLSGGMTGNVVSHPSLALTPQAPTELSVHASTFLGNLGADMDTVDQAGMHTVPSSPWTPDMPRLSFGGPWTPHGRRTSFAMQASPRSPGANSFFVKDDASMLMKVRSMVSRV